MKTVFLSIVIAAFIVFASSCGNETEAPTAPEPFRNVAAAPQMVAPHLEVMPKHLVEYQGTMYGAFEVEDPPRLRIQAIQWPDNPTGEIEIKVTVEGQPGHNVIYSNYPVRIGYPAHVLFYGNPSTYPAMALAKDNTFNTVIYYTGEDGTFSFYAKSRTGQNAWIELDVGGRLFKVALVGA